MTDKTTTTPVTGVSPSNQDQAALALKSNVIDGARELTDEMKHLAGDVAGEARKTAESSISAGKKRATEGLDSVANAIRKTGEHLRAEDQGAFTQYFDNAAHGVDAVSAYLQRRTLGQVVGDVEQFARREPALFLGGAFVVGLVGGRFLKSSKPAASSGGHAAGERNGGTHDFGHLGRQGRSSPIDAPARSGPDNRGPNERVASNGQGSAAGGPGSRETNSSTSQADDGHRSGVQSAKPKASPSADASTKPKSGSQSSPPKTSGAT